MAFTKDHYKPTLTLLPLPLVQQSQKCILQLHLEGSVSYQV